MAVAAPDVGVERDAYVPRPYGVLSVSPCMTLMSSGWMPSSLGDDLGERRLVALTLRLAADLQDRLAGRMDPKLGAVVHLHADDVVVLRRPGPDDLGERCATPMP